MRVQEAMVVSIFLLLTVSGTALANPEEPARPLRVVTYNLLHGGIASGFLSDRTHLAARIEMAIHELKALDPDIVALQEVSRSRLYPDVPERLARALGLNLVFAAATDRIVGFRPFDTFIVRLIGFREGSAILSRFPIVSSDAYHLPRCRKLLDPRILLRAVLSTPWGPLQVFSTHTSRDDCQTERVGQIVREHRGTGPSLLMGDFNTPETSPVMNALLDQAGFVDAFRSANPRSPGLTVWQRIEAEQPTVFRRVDYIFLLDGRELTAEVRSSRVVLDRPGRLANGRALWPSDHYGVLAEIEIVPRPATRE